MDAKRVALVVGIAALLPLFLGLFVDAVYPQPEYDRYCNNYYSAPQKIPLSGVNCSNDFGPEYNQCFQDGGSPNFTYDPNNCQVYNNCDMCSKTYNDANMVYNRNIFFMLAPLGLIIVVIGLYLAVEYIGAGLMFAGLITMFYATVRYFTDMSKIARALVILIELLIIVWIGFKKIGKNDGKVADAKAAEEKSVTPTANIVDDKTPVKKAAIVRSINKKKR